MVFTGWLQSESRPTPTLRRNQTLIVDIGQVVAPPDYSSPVGGNVHWCTTSPVRSESTTGVVDRLHG